MYKSCIFCLFQPFLRRSFILISLMSVPHKIWFCQFAHCALLFVSRSAIAPKIKVRSRAKSDWGISKRDVPSSGIHIFLEVGIGEPVYKIGSAYLTEGWVQGWGWRTWQPPSRARPASIHTPSIQMFRDGLYFCRKKLVKGTVAWDFLVWVFLGNQGQFRVFHFTFRVKIVKSNKFLQFITWKVITYRI